MRTRPGIRWLLALLPPLVNCGSDGTSGAPALDGGMAGSDSGGVASAADAGYSASDAGSTPGDDATTGPADAGNVDYDQVAPTPSASWVNVTNNLAGKASECGNTSAVVSDPRADRLIVGIAMAGLWASTDGAATWTALGKTGDPIKNRLTGIVFDPTNAGTFWESGVYGWETGTAGVFLTTDNGASFKGYPALATAAKGGNTNDSVSVDFSSPARKTMLAGTHETANSLFLSTDAGASWADIGSKLPSGLGFCTSTLVLDAKTLIVGCAASYSGKAGVILRSTDTGNTFTKVFTSGVVGQPLWASDGTIYFAAEGGGIDRSTDQGKTWTSVASNTTAGTVRPLELPDGRIVSAEQKNLVITKDKGAHWTTLGPPAPYVPVGLAYSPFRRAFFISYFTCAGSNAVPADAIVRSGWDYQANP